MPGTQSQTHAVTPTELTLSARSHRHERALKDIARGEVRFGRHDRMLYSTDASIYQVEPMGVVIPADLDDLARIVRYCAESGVPMLPRGGGTSLAGQCVNRAVVIDLSAGCTRLLRVDAERRACEVEAGITIDDLNDRLRALGHRLFFAPDPATARQCNIGGAIGNNAAGTRSIRYGRTSESLIGVDAMLADGSTAELSAGSAVRDPAARRLATGVIEIVRRHERLIRERFPKTLRRNAGYALDMMLGDIARAHESGRDPLEVINLAHLVCGSEGTLAFTQRATLRLHPTPVARGLGVIGFASLDEAMDAVVPLLELKPSAVELLDDMVIGLARKNLECAPFVALMPQPREGMLAAVLYVEFSAERDAGEIEERFGALRRVVQGVNARASLACLSDPVEVANALRLRKAGEPLLHGIPGARKPLGFVEDNAVPVERLSEFVREFRRIVESKGTRAAFYAHASVGVLHVRPLLDLRDADDRRRMEEIAVEVADLAASLGGVMSGEHGDGRARGPLLERYFGPELMGAFREVKALFDPHHLLNPGNIVSPGDIASIHETTRVRPHGANLPHGAIETYFDYSAEGGFDHAVELCNGSGVCRKKQGGTMCPSYMATLDERHSTRGRGNALRLAITGQFDGGEPAWNDRDTMATLDLCLSCKGCKTECPTNVDIAQYKAEYLAQSYRGHGVPMRARVFGHVRALNRIGSALMPVSNWVLNARAHRFVLNRLLGLAPERELPRFGKSLFRQGRALRHGPAAKDAPCLVLFGDCFTAYNEPEIGLDAVRLLGAFGYRVEVVDAGCCGRALISTGCLDDATRVIGRTAARLTSVVREHSAVGVVVCEPSCLSAIKDEWRRLKSLSDEARSVGRGASLVEQFLADNWDSHPMHPEFGVPDGRVLLHGHCHQKALWGAGSTAKMLARAFGADRVRVLDTGCCGMAGSFGYTADRYELSMRIGDLALFPAVRAMGAGDVLVAPGTSCRHQVREGVGVEGEHPVRLLARMLRDSGD
ncbi:MAG: FAD-binding protein [Phycisphaerales bacterium]|nr:FAD-binding protein [Phycisphaerales bacterium]